MLATNMRYGPKSDFDFDSLSHHPTGQEMDQPHVLNLSSISLATFPVSSSLVHLEVAGSGLRDLEEDLEEDQQIRSYLDAFCLWQRKRRMVIASKYS